MYYSPQSLKQPQLKSSELVILKSLALGLGCDTIKNLLELSEEEFEKKLNSLYTKLQVFWISAVAKDLILRLKLNFSIL